MLGKVSRSSGGSPSRSVKSTESSGSRVESKGGVTSAPDTIEISQEAQNLEKIVGTFKIELDRVPDVRAEKVEIATSRVRQGFYDAKEVIKEIAGVLLKNNLV